MITSWYSLPVKAVVSGRARQLEQKKGEWGQRALAPGDPAPAISASVTVSAVLGDGLLRCEQVADPVGRLQSIAQKSHGIVYQTGGQLRLQLRHFAKRRTSSVAEILSEQ